MKMSEIRTFCSPGGLKTYRICLLFVGLGAGARKSSRKPLFSWKFTHFIKFYGNPLKWVDFHEKCGFLSFWRHLLQTIQKRCIFYRFWAPPGSKKWEFHTFSWNSHHLVISMKITRNGGIITAIPAPAEPWNVLEFIAIMCVSEQVGKK